MLGVRRGGVLLRPEAHAEAQGGARECVPGAVLAALGPCVFIMRSETRIGGDDEYGACSYLLEYLMME